MPRLFTALPLPANIAEQLACFRDPLPGVRWLEPADYHITLRFAGDIANPLAREFADSLSRIDIDSFELKLKGFGAFGGHDPRVLWAGISPSSQLEALQRANERAARQAGLKPERQQFKPHVTIARLRNSDPDAVSEFLQAHSSALSAPFLADRFHLLSSKPRTGGGPYVIEEDYPLRGFHWPDDTNEDRDGYHIWTDN